MFILPLVAMVKACMILSSHYFVFLPAFSLGTKQDHGRKNAKRSEQLSFTGAIMIHCQLFEPSPNLGGERFAAIAPGPIAERGAGSVHPGFGTPAKEIL